MERPVHIQCTIVALAIGFMLCGLTGCDPKHIRDEGWPTYLGDHGRNHFSALSQIDTTNVQSLRVAWTYHSGDTGQVQCNPLIIDGRLYGVTASNYLFALDAATGEELWQFVPERTGPSNVNRGVAYWRKGDRQQLMYAFQSWLYAVDPESGLPIPTFGDNGRVSLRSGLGEAAADKFVASTTPGTIFNDLIIMPIRVSEGVDAAPGFIQAFNVITGALEWVFRTIPGPGEWGFDTWPAGAHENPVIGGANNWAGMALDEKRGIVYIPTGSAAFDFYGGNRKGQNLFANSLLALRAATGEYVWHYQMVHHDVWDRDLPAPPNLVTLTIDGKQVDAVAQVTKSGHVFVFDREDGTPIFPIDEVPVPASTLPGEETWPTQPIPRLPQPFARQVLHREDINTFAEGRDSILRIYDNANKGLYHPLELNQTILFPGADGGAEWGGAAVDTDGIMYVNSNEMAWLFSLSPRIPAKSGGVITGQQLYTAHCATCHQADFSGSPASGYPGLRGLKEKMSRTEIATLIAAGKGMMPGFAQINKREQQAIIGYLFGEEKTEVASANQEEVPEVPYTFNGYNKFLDGAGYPAISPPWGTLTAIDLNAGQHIWQIPLGEHSELTARGIPITGTENYGGPIVTAGGLLFIAATRDNMFRAFDRKTGRLLWDYELPAAGFATPATYSIAGKQYVVIACGGTKLGTRGGDSYVAFALP